MSNTVSSTEGAKTSSEKIADLRAYHQSTFDSLGVSNALFFPKMAYKPRDKNEVYISFFPSELKRVSDIYTEFVSRDYVSEDPNRSLWKWRYNPHWQEEYEPTEPNDLGNTRYLVPVSELIKISSVKPSTTLKPTSGSNDAPISDMTIRDFAAIMTGKPLSNKQWINQMMGDNK